MTRPAGENTQNSYRKQAHRRLLAAMLCCAATAASFAATGCEPTSGAARHRNLSPELLFRLHCSQCHGDGSGNGHRVPALKGKPKDMTTRQWQASVTDEHLAHVIAEGGPAAKLHSDMPAWNRQLSKKQIEGLVKHIRTLGK